MISVVTGGDILKAAKEICGKSEVYLAVSYWGYGAARELGITEESDVKIALDVNAGGTNPIELNHLIDTIKHSRIKVHKDLHMKIYASKTLTLVGSANASASGLNVDGKGHAEACVRIDGDEAIQAYEIAKDLFENKSEKFRLRHLDICFSRFGSSTIGNRITGDSSEYTALEMLQKHPELIGSYPIIISNGDIDPNIEEKILNDRKLELNEGRPDAADQDILSLWGLYGWELPHLLNKTCIAVHRDNDREIYISFVKIHTPRDNFTPAQYLDWSQFEFLKNPRENSIRVLKRNNPKLHNALDGIISNIANNDVSGAEFAKLIRKELS